METHLICVLFLEKKIRIKIFDKGIEIHLICVLLTSQFGNILHTSVYGDTSDMCITFYDKS